MKETRPPQTPAPAELYAAIRNIPDFPKPGIQFKDITPLLSNPAAFRSAIELFVTACRNQSAQKIAGIDARGFLFGATVAYEMGIGFVPIRKKGKLPYQTRSISYELEYGSSAVEVHTDAFAGGDRVVLIDDLLATGGTASAAIKLIESCEARVVEAIFLIELTALDGRGKLAPHPVRSILQFD
jgi:adenine phosphoribosyltransferase